ncbi:MAG: extradiol dioxygenase [Gammaproteobacteria bacterium]|jgi:predicted enzyme related to lactoylglutathione lyase|nr:extradiol dioxygenase [Gammaproteobacteria bacterium]
MRVQKSAIDLGIITNNLEPMLAFYRDLLELEVEAVIDMPGGGVMHRFKAGDSIIKVIETDPKPEMNAAPGGIRGATGYRYWTLHVMDLAGAMDKLEAAGVKIVVPSKTIRPGVKIAIVADPDGNWVELLSNA